MLTEEEYQKLKNAETIIDTFIRSKYCTRATVPMLQDMKVIYEKYVKRKITIFCSSCVLTMFKSLKKLLLEYEQNDRRNNEAVGRTADDNDSQGTGSDISDTDTTRPVRKRKRTRKKKQE